MESEDEAMTDAERMAAFFGSVRYEGTPEELRPWQEVPELATTEDEPHDPDPVPSKSKKPKKVHLGDVEGHPFRGNQWTGGGSSDYAAHPRVFNQTDEIGQFDSWGEKRWGWKDPETGEVTGRLLMGEPIPHEELPETLYHVTTNAPAVEKSGVLFGQLDSGGLGGGQAEGVSFTRSKEDARVIQRELVRAVKIARGDTDETSFEQWAREDEKEAGLPKGSLAHAVNEAVQQWDGNKAIMDKPYHYARVPDPEWIGGKLQRIETPAPPEERERLRVSALKDSFNAYLWGRETASQQATGHKVDLLKNPILFGDQDKLKKLDPDNISTLTVPTKNIPAKALVTTGSDNFLHEVRVYSDVPTEGTSALKLSYRAKLAFLLGDTPGHAFRGNQWTDGGGAADAPILHGVDYHANAEALIAAKLYNLENMGQRPTAEDLKATEAELRALPLVHGTTVAGALGALDDGLLSHADMEKQAAEFHADVTDLNDELTELAGESLRSPDFEKAHGMVSPYIGDWDEGQLQNKLGLDRDTAKAVHEKLQEIHDLQNVIDGKTYSADKKVGLDRFVFMTQGAKHQDYGTVGVVIDNAVVKDGFATEHDIYQIHGIQSYEGEGDPNVDPNTTEFDDKYTAKGVETYKHGIVKGDDYYMAAAAAAGKPEALQYRSRDDLFEIKAPKVPAKAVKGFIVDNLDDAERLADKLARKGIKGKILFTDPTSSRNNAAYVHQQMKHIQATGEWDRDLAAKRDDDTGNSGATMILVRDR